MTTDAIDDRIREALAGYTADPAKADLLLQVACTQAADLLPLYRVLYKFYNRQRRFEAALDYARSALSEATRQGDLPQAFSSWTRAQLSGIDPLLASQALLALKALAFISLRSGDEMAAKPFLEKLGEIDPEDGSGASVVQALAEGVGGVGLHFGAAIRAPNYRQGTNYS